MLWTLGADGNWLETLPLRHGSTANRAQRVTVKFKTSEPTLTVHEQQMILPIYDRRREERKRHPTHLICQPSKSALIWLTGAALGTDTPSSVGNHSGHWRSQYAGLTSLDTIEGSVGSPSCQKASWVLKGSLQPHLIDAHQGRVPDEPPVRVYASEKFGEKSSRATNIHGR